MREIVQILLADSNNVIPMDSPESYGHGRIQAADMEVYTAISADPAKKWDAYDTMIPSDSPWFPNIQRFPGLAQFFMKWPVGVDVSLVQEPNSVQEMKKSLGPMPTYDFIIRPGNEPIGYDLRRNVLRFARKAETYCRRCEMGYFY